MKSLTLSLVLFGSLVAVAYGTGANNWNEYFDTETENCPKLCTEPPSTGNEENITIATEGYKTTTSNAGLTTKKGFTSVSAGYTPTTGECVCVTENATPSGEATTSSQTNDGSTPLWLVSTTTSENGVTDSNSGSGDFESHCIIIEVFWNFTAYFEGELKVIWIDFIHECENTIFDIELGYSDEIKFSKVVIALLKLFESYEEIEYTLRYKWIAEWGIVMDLKTVLINTKYSYVNATITLDEHGSCPLFESLLNYTESDNEKQQACEELISELTVIIENNYYSYFDKLYEINVKFEAFFEVHESWKVEFESFEIENFGDLKTFLYITYTFQQISSIDVVLGGSTSDCLLIKKLQEAYSNESYSVSVRSDIKQLCDKLTSEFEVTVDVSARLAIFMNVSFEFYVEGDWIVTYLWGLEVNDWGSFYEIICAGYISEECGWESYITTEAPSSSTDSFSSSIGGETTTAAESTTAAISTTTEATGNCGTREHLITISNNHTLLTDAINEAYKTWSTSYQNQFKGYKSRAEKIIWGSGEVTAKLYNVSIIYGNYATDERETTLKAVKISTWGTVNQFCSCDGQ